MLKRYSMIGDGLSHVSFGALSVAVAFGWAPLAVSIPVVAAAAVLLLRITGNGKIKSDAAIAMISAGSLAVGIIVTSLTTGMTTDVSSYMFGSIHMSRGRGRAPSPVLTSWGCSFCATQGVRRDLR
ncbi:MAG: metal ABC transporter permease [Enterocloster sp.]